MKKGTIKRLKIEVEGMTCETCPVHVSEIISSIEEVVDVHIPNWQTGKVFVTARDNFSINKLKSKMKVTNYKVKSIKQLAAQDIPLNSESWDFDIAIIGTGGAGMAAAIKAAEEGKKVCIIEMGNIGGTCVNVGCIPSKILIRAAEMINKINHPHFLGINSTIEIDWKKILEQKNQLVAQLRNEKYVDVINSYNKISLIKGKATFNLEGELIVENKKINAKKIIIATGSKPKILSIFNKKEIPVLTSASVMELSTLPKSIIIIGGRAVALELGQMLLHMGVKVTVIQRSSRILPQHDRDIAMLLQKYMTDEGMKIYTDTKIVDVNISKDKKSVTIETEEEKHTLIAEHILVATGREPNTKNMGLENVGVKVTDGGFIQVNEYMQTSNPRIYAAGDVTTLPKFVYVAAMSGSIASFNAIYGNNRTIDLSVLPSVIFTTPQLATVGLTEDEAKKQGYKIKVSSLNLNHVPYDLTLRDTRGIVKLIADQESDRLIGAHILCENAGEIIQTAALIIYFGYKYNVTIDEVLGTFFPYLVQVEAIKLAMLGLKKDITKLSCCAN